MPCLPTFHVTVLLSSLGFFWMGVHFGSIAFDQLTGLETILLAKHALIKQYDGDARLDLLRKLDIIIAENGPELERQETPQKSATAARSQQTSNEPPPLSKNTAYGILNTTNMYKGVYIPSVYRRNMEDVVKFHEYMKYRPSGADTIEGDLPTPVIILTYYRAGSSFFSQILNQHPDVFYNFEPIFPYGRDCTSHVAEKIQVLQKLARCNFLDSVNWSEKYKREGLQKGSKLSYNDKACISYGSCFRTNSKAMCDAELCPQPKGQVGKLPCAYCGQLNLYKTSEVCRSKKVVAIKVIRICQLNWLLDLVRTTPKLKIIHLVRDPRALANSRLKLHAKDGDFNALENITSECGRQIESHRIGVELGRNDRDLPDVNDERMRKFFQQNYLEVRYEDTAIDPKGVTSDILDFVGLEAHRDIDNWIEKNSNEVRRKKTAPDNLEIDANVPQVVRDSQVAGESMVNINSMQQLLRAQSQQVIGYGPNTRTKRDTTAAVPHQPVLYRTDELPEKTIMQYVWADTKEPAYNRTILKSIQSPVRSPKLLDTSDIQASHSKNYNIYRRMKSSAHRNPFSTVRLNSASTAIAWRRSLPLELAKLIEKSDSCRDLMLAFGYKPLPDDLSEERYKDTVGSPIDVF